MAILEVGSKWNIFSKATPTRETEAYRVANGSEIVIDTRVVILKDLEAVQHLLLQPLIQIAVIKSCVPGLVG